MRAHWSHPDFVEGPRAFAERRKPRWNADPKARIDAAKEPPDDDG